MIETNEDLAARYPAAWRDVGHDFDPRVNMMQFERFDKRTQRKAVSDYMTVQNRLLWFIKDQRALILAGVGTVPYSVETECVELDREAGWAHFRTTVRDVLGNVATMYGSESVRDFPDYAEKASTKSLGRALLCLGYGTAFAPEEMDEGERVVDSPRQRREPAEATTSSAGGNVTPMERRTPPPPATATAKKQQVPAPASPPAGPATQQEIRRLMLQLGFTDAVAPQVWLNEQIGRTDVVVSDLREGKTRLTKAEAEHLRRVISDKLKERAAAAAAEDEDTSVDDLPFDAAEEGG